MKFNVAFGRKQNEILTSRCSIGEVVEIPFGKYVSFKRNLMGDYDFIKDFAKQQRLHPGDDNPCLLVLTPGEREGILVDAEGYDYARYTAFIPDARSMLLFDRHRSLQSFAEAMDRLVDRYAEQAVNCQQSGVYRLLSDDMENLIEPDLYNETLFMLMLRDRPEISHVEKIGDEFHITVAPQFVVRDENRGYPELSKEDVDLMCARHVLWLNDAGGERAVFSTFRIKDLDLSNRNLNGAILDDAVFDHVRMRDIELCDASGSNAVFKHCDMTGMTAEEALFRFSVFKDCNLSNAYLTHSNLAGTEFDSCNLDGTVLRGCCVQDTTYPNCDRSACDEWNQSDDEKAWLSEGLSAAECPEDLT